MEQTKQTREQFAGELADALQSLWVLGDKGLIDYGYTDTYAEVMGASLEDVEDAFDDAFGILIERGVVTESGGEYYATEEYDEWRRMEREEAEDWEQYQTDVRQAYHQSIWG